jgi:hypothetical protein
MPIKYKKLLTILLVMYFTSSGFVAIAAEKLKLVYFSANWNYTSRKGSDVIKKAVKEIGHNIEIQEIDVDSITTSAAANKLDLRIPNKIPYYIILKEKNEVVLQNAYNGEGLGEMKQILQNAISKAKN